MARRPHHPHHHAYENFSSPSHRAARFQSLSHAREIYIDDNSHGDLDESSLSVTMLQGEGESPMSDSPILDRNRRASSLTAYGLDSSQPEPFTQSLMFSVSQIPIMPQHEHCHTDRLDGQHHPLSASRLALAAKQMDLQELHQLHEFLASSSVDLGQSFASSKWSIRPSEHATTAAPLGMSHLSSIHSGYNMQTLVASNHQKGGFGSSFFNATMDVGHSALHTSQSSVNGNNGTASERPTISTATGQMPRESVALLIDAVRGSTLPGDDRCRFLFELFDADQKGMLSRDGVADFIDATLLASRLQLYGDVQCRDIVERIFSGTAHTHYMTYREFCEAFGPLLTGENASTASSDSTTASSNGNGPAASAATPQASRQVPTWRRRLVSYYRKHDAEIIYLCAYALMMMGAFYIKSHYVDYDPAAWYWPKIAKGFAQIIMVNTLFLLLPMCRNFVAFLRRFAAISSRVPVDQNIEFHKICGVVMLLSSLGHTVAWVCIVYQLRTVSDEVMATSRFQNLSFVRDESIASLLPTIPIWTGAVMVLIAAIAGPLTHARIRRGNFNTFWMTHIFFVPFLALIILHGVAAWVQPPQASFWVLPPLMLYAIEKRYRVSNIFGGQTRITKVKFLQGTCAIYMEKPDNFHYHPGMYMFVNVPAVSRFEWHPFTISSAPEDDYVSVHIRNAGDWTNALHATLRKALEDHKNGGNENYLPTAATAFENTAFESTGFASTAFESTAFGSVQGGAAGPRLLDAVSYPPIFIDGPVGAPSQDYYRYESVVFVGAGIGVTPFASILQSIVHQWEAFRCNRCNHVKMPKTFKLKKIYFYWITRDQEALTWFAETMNRLSALDVEGRLEIHNYFSPLKDDAVIIPLHALQRLMHEMDGQDIISGLATKQLTHFGRPNWKKELTRIAAQQDTSKVGLGGVAQKLRVGVFFCGPKPMGNQIHNDSFAFNVDEKRESPKVLFDFHSENF